MDLRRDIDLVGQGKPVRGQVADLTRRVDRVQREFGAARSRGESRVQLQSLILRNQTHLKHQLPHLSPSQSLPAREILRLSFLSWRETLFLCFLCFFLSSFPFWLAPETRFWFPGAAVRGRREAPAAPASTLAERACALRFGVVTRAQPPAQSTDKKARRQGKGQRHRQVVSKQPRGGILQHFQSPAGRQRGREETFGVGGISEKLHHANDHWHRACGAHRT